MRFDDRFLEEVKSRVRLSDVIGRTVKLRRQGREYVGLSPFNAEKSPSFFVNDDKGFFHDFSSGKHGDLISFLQETERLSFHEAVERLAAEAGVPLPEPDPRAREQEQARAGLADWLAAAAAWFEGELRRPGGAEARAYLLRRGLPEAEWARFGVGYAPAGRTALKDYLVTKGARPDALVEAGLLIQPEEGGGAPYDRFRERIIFPIADGRGRVISFGGRALDPQARAKYLNGPETPLFHKGRTLYGLPEARRLLHVREREDAAAAAPVVVEGYLDVIACHRAGVPAVAPLGTALTEEQMEALWRLAPEPVLAFDADGAGQRAAHRAMDRALPLLQPGRSFRFALMAGGKDPDDVLREQGADALRAQLSATRPFVEVLFEREQAAEPLDTPERKAGLKVRLRKLAAAIADRDLSQAYREDLLARYDAAVGRPAAPARTASEAGRLLSYQRKGVRFRRPLHELQATSQEGIAAARAALAQPSPFSAMVARGAVERPIVVDDHLDLLAAEAFGDAALDPLARDIIDIRVMLDLAEAEPVRRELARRGRDEALGRLARDPLGLKPAFLDLSLPEMEARILWNEAYERLVELLGLERAVADAAADGDVDSVFRLKPQRDHLRRALRDGAALVRA